MLTIAIYVVTAICFAFLTSEVLFVLISALAKDRTDRITFLRSFKKGKCVVIYVTAIPLYVMGLLYSGMDFLKALFTSVNKIINLVVLKYDFGGIEALMADNLLYQITIYFCFVLVAVNALIFVFSISAQYIWEYFQGIKAMTSRRDKVFILGSNEKSVTIFKSDKEKRCKVIIDKLDKERSISLYLEKIPYISTPYPERMATRILKLVKRDARRNKKRKTSVIINTRNDEENIKLCKAFLNAVFESEERELIKVLELFSLYVYGDPKYEAIYEDIISSARGSFHYTNEYQKIALDFAHKYPTTAFMDDRYIDYDTSLVRDNVDINAILVGFGKTNQQILLSMATNNVLVTKGDDGVSLKRINTLVFDKANGADEDKNLNHSYNRFATEMKKEIEIEERNKELYKLASEEPDEKKKEKILSGIQKTGYLPLPEQVMSIESEKLSISNGAFYDKIRSVVANEKGKQRLTYIIIAFGTDLENIDMAQKLVEKLAEWDASDVIVFVKARGWTKEQSFLEQKNCYFIGNEKEVGFNLENIIGDKWLDLAKSRDALYTIEKQVKNRDEITEELFERVKSEVGPRWHARLSNAQRESNIFACLNIRLKLQLMGLDYRKRASDSTDAIDQDEYYKIYMGKSPEVSAYSSTGRAVLKQGCGLEIDNGRRGVLAIQEHLRWNAFMLSKGIVPSSIEKILSEKENGEYTNGKNYPLRRHGNITTIEGLVEFRKMIAERDGIDEYDADVIKYDYEILDDMYWLLDNCGYEIVKKS